MALYAEQTATAVGGIIGYPSMNFRAIIAGWLVATAIAGLLYVFGLALGFSAFDAWNTVSNAKGIGIGTAIWMILTWAAALLLGGIFASWFDGRNDQTSGTLHGVTVWGLSVTATGLWIALGLGHAMHGQANGTGMETAHEASAMHSSLTGAGDPGAVAVLDADIAAQLTGHDHEKAGPIVAALIIGHDDTAANLLAADNSTTSEGAMQTLQRLSPQISAARTEAKIVSDRTAYYTAMSLWIVFISIFLALLTSAVGGWLGAGHIHRVYHLHNYAGRTLE